ncbi:MAG: type I restriction enzyme S subunit [Flavobacteriaceae bacterium]|jgi:type I restriction enzyme S subunit
MSWEEKELVHIIDFYNNQRVPLSGIERSKVQGIYPYHGAQGVVDHINKYIFDGKYILVAEDGENLRSRNQDIARFANGQFWVNNHAHIIRGKKGICDDYFLKVNLNLIDIGGYVTGAAQPKLSMTNLRRIKINLPPLQTQKRIADILSGYDDLIENNLKRIKLLEQAAQNIYKEWFVNLRFPEYENTPINEETGLPQGWRNGVVSDLCEVKSGFAFKSKHWKKEGNPVMKIKNINNNTVDIDNSDFVDNDVAGLAKKYELFPGDVIIAMTGATVGKVGLIPKIGKRIYLNQRVGLFRPLTEENDNIALVFSFFLTDDSQQQVLNFAQGAAQPNISGSEIGNIKLNIADSKVLSQFNKMIKPSFQLVQSLYGQNQKLKAARDILLPRLMNRTIEV